MPDDPFERWRQGRPYGSYRQVTDAALGVTAVPVVRDAGHKIYAANSFFAASEPTSDGVRVQVSFDFLSKQRQIVFLPDSPTPDGSPEPAVNDTPPPNSGIVRNTLTELCTVELSATIAAQLARALIERLAASAPDALKSVGLELQANGG